MSEFLGFMSELFQPHQFLESVIGQLGGWVYGVLFAIIFAETGLVVTPFLPGDSLLFAAGAIAGAGYLDIGVLMGVLLFAAIAGDAVNYAIGRRFGVAVLRRGSKLVKQEHVDMATGFFERHGGKAVVLARFVPIVRTFVPFVAGMCGMKLTRFWTFNVSGAIVWVVLFTGAGYLFGNLPWVEENLTLGMIVIVFLSVLPVIVETIRHRTRKDAQPAVQADTEV